MKFSFTFKNKSLATRFTGALEERKATSIESQEDEDGNILISYAMADCQEDKKSYSEEDIDERVYSIVSDFAEYMMKEMQWQMNWVNSELDYLYSEFYKHQQGHIPKISSPSQMSAALKTLGLDGDYDVMKKVVYAKEGMKISKLS